MNLSLFHINLRGLLATVICFSCSEEEPVILSAANASSNEVLTEVTSEPPHPILQDNRCIRITKLSSDYGQGTHQIGWSYYYDSAYRLSSYDGVIKGGNESEIHGQVYYSESHVAKMIQSEVGRLSTILECSFYWDNELLRSIESIRRHTITAEVLDQWTTTYQYDIYNRLKSYQTKYADHLFQALIAYDLQNNVIGEEVTQKRVGQDDLSWTATYEQYDRSWNPFNLLNRMGIFSGGPPDHSINNPGTLRGKTTHGETFGVVYTYEYNDLGYPSRIIRQETREPRTAVITIEYSECAYL